MKPKTTLILLVMAAALFAFIKFYEKKVPTTREAEAQRDRVLASFDRDKVKRIEIRNNDATIELERNDDKWEMDAPVKDRADSSAVAQLMTSLETMRSKARIDAKNVSGQQEKDFGLKNPKLRLKLEGNRMSRKLVFGNDTAIEGQGYYMQLDKDDSVLVVNNDLKTQLGKPADDFRDHQLIQHFAADAERMVIRSKAGEIEVVKDGNDWNVAKPFKARADADKILDLVAQLSNARITGFAAESKKEVYGLAEPAGSVALDFQGQKKRVEIKFGRAPEKDADKIYASLSDRNGIFALPKATSTVLDTKPNDVRDRHLVRLNPDIVDRITIVPAAGEPVVLARKEEDWIIKSAGDQPANASQAMDVLNAFKNHHVKDFVSDVASELAKYGLKKPQIRLTFSSYATDNTAESKAGEQDIATIAFGKIEGDTVYAQLEDEPFIVSVEKSLLDKLPATAERWRSLKVFDLDPAKVEQVEVTRGKDIVTLKREDGVWKSDSGKVQETNTQSFLNTLAKLRAVRWVDPLPKSQGLEPPAMTIKFTTDDGTQRTVRIGGPTPEEMWYCDVDGETGVFMMNRPDHETLVGALIQNGKPDRVESAPLSSPPSSPAGSATQPVAAPPR